MPSDTRDRIVTATSELFRARGYHGTSLKHVTAASGAPIGSVYHFFPGGKVALAEAVITESGAAYRALFELIADAAPDPVAAVRDFFEGAAEVLVETGYLDACPIGTVALEVASTNDRLRLATHAVFTGWIDAVSARLVAAGVPASEAGELAVTLVAAIEGGFMLSRAARSPEPMRTAGRLMQRLVAAALTTTTDVPG
jgi:AcrR family transcriptional regulator